jgi:hypothetical protein
MRAGLRSAGTRDWWDTQFAGRDTGQLVVDLLHPPLLPPQLVHINFMAPTGEMSVIVADFAVDARAGFHVCVR